MLRVDLTPIFSLKGGGPDAPTDLVTSEVTHYSFRASWTGPEGPVEKYRVEYMTLSGRPQQVHTFNLHPNTTLSKTNPSVTLPLSAPQTPLSLPLYQPPNPSLSPPLSQTPLSLPLYQHPNPSVTPPLSQIPLSLPPRV